MVTGQVDRGADVLPAFDMLLHTGNVESFGMVILEAMAAGLPVVAAATGGPEYVLGKLGCFPAQDTAAGYAAAMEQALTLDEEQYAKAAWQRFESMSSTATMANMLPNLVEFVNEPETDPFKPLL